jgi:hypothetical protein
VDLDSVEDESEDDGEDDEDEVTEADQKFIDDEEVDEEDGDPIAMAAIIKGSEVYHESSAELQDVISNYVKCAGQWDLVDRFQSGIMPETLPRFKKMIKEAARLGQVKKKFSKSEKGARPTLASNDTSPTTLLHLIAIWLCLFHSLRYQRAAVVATAIQEWQQLLRV